jgi:DNA processing protein
MLDGFSRVLEGAQIPLRLLELGHPPSRVHLCGDLPAGPSAAIVGTRKPTPEARRFAFRLAADLSRAGVAVLSGGAKGIDHAAHLGALRGRGATLVVAPSGFFAPYPEEHAALYAAVLERNGGYLSLVGDDVVAHPANFFARNAVLAALAHVLVVVEMPLRSGARNAARWARKLGRPLLVVPAVPWNVQGRGCLLELRRGALLCEGAADVLREVERVLLLPEKTLTVPERPPPLVEPRRPVVPQAQTELPFFATFSEKSELDAVLRAVREGATHQDAVSERSGLPAAAVQRHVLTLTLGGVLAPDPTGGFRCVSATEPVSVRKNS